MIWGSIRAFRTTPAPTPPPAAEVATETPLATPTTEQPPSSPALPGRKSSGLRSSASAPSAASSLPRSASASRSGKAKPRVAGSEVATSAGVHQVLPDVPDRARRTIRGHVRVSVRVIVEQDGSVFAALSETRGPSRYFERLALDAAKKWTFPPAQASAQRLMLVKFDFARDGVTAQSSALK